MTTTTISYTDETTGRTYTAELDGTTVEIREDGILAGKGRWDGSQIQDCAAILGGSQEAADRIYDVLSEELADAQPAFRVVVGEKGNEQGHVMPCENGFTHAQAVEFMAEEVGRYEGHGWGRVEASSDGVNWERV